MPLFGKRRSSAKKPRRDPRKRYGFLFGAQLSARYPGAEIIGGRSLPTGRVHWAVTEYYAGMARNHCASVCATNLVLCLQALRSAELPGRAFTETRDELFRTFHDLIGNGPVFFLARSMKRFSASMGRSALTRRVRGFDGIRSVIDDGRPAALLLAAGPFDWHWVLCVGWRRIRTAGGAHDLLQIVNSWDPTGEVWYEPGRGARIMAAVDIRFGKRAGR